ncbi:LuxR C-terminal-related transcriptional regulator [Streptomyces sp. NBC_00101]|uniref:helix-turn-helix transcriptional regulator n=1 Tax=Streptomyces sp. NBC_00101 TaxID=2975651 RepID=UPI0038677627
MTPSTTVHSPLRLYGRSGELAIVETFLGRLAQGDGGALVVTAPPGLGRSALLDAAVAAHHARSGGPVLRAAAVPAERRLARSGLHALLCSAPGPLSVPADRVLRSGFTPDTLLTLLREAGADRPALVCVDDAHAWDPESRAALGFAARRLGAGSRAAVLITAADETSFAGLPALRLGPLDDRAAAALLERLTGRTDIDPVVRGELVREAAGNPRLLAGLVGHLTADQVAGRTVLPFPLPGGESVLDAHAAQLDGLPAGTRTLLLLAAAAQEHEPEGTGADAGLLLRAGHRAGLGAPLLDRALFGPGGIPGILERTGSRVHFSHPLLSRAVLRHAPSAHRRAAHELLAALLGQVPALPLPALVQRACAAPAPDAALADALERAAASPRPHAERSAALIRAALLSTDEAERAARFAAAAEHARLAGDTGRARALLARVAAGPGTPVPPARTPAGTAPRRVPAGGLAPFTRGMLALRDGPAADAREALLAAAAGLAPHDPGRAVAALLAAAEAAWASGDAIAYLDALGRIPDRPHDPSVAPYLAGVRAVFAGRTAQGHELLAQCLRAAEADDDTGALLRATACALVVGEAESACRAGARALAAVRSTGPEVLLAHALEQLAYAELRAGRHSRARAHALEGLHAARRTGQSNTSTHLHAVLALAASVEGPAEACAAHADTALAGAGPHGLVQAATLATWAVARADLAAGRTGEAAARLAPLVRPGPRHGHFGIRMLALPCYVEAAVLAGRSVEWAAELADGVREFEIWTARTVDPHAPAQLARCRALLAPADEAEARYTEALAHHDVAGGDFERARTQLLYGQWLRRRRRTREARDPLRDALVGFERCSARAWAERATGELRAAGEAVDPPATDGGTPAGLTPQQQRVARCVAEGATNREIARRLSLSPRTVDHHLRNVFAVLGVRSRTELARVMGE